MAGHPEMKNNDETYIWLKDCLNAPIPSQEKMDADFQVFLDSIKKRNVL